MGNKTVDFLIDSGAEVSVLTKPLVKPDWYTGELRACKAMWGSKKFWPMATIPVTINGQATHITAPVIDETTIPVIGHVLAMEPGGFLQSTQEDRTTANHAAHGNTRLLSTTHTYQ